MRTALAQYLKDKRTAADLSQKDIATRLGYTTSQFISNWERGISMPPVSSLKVIAEAYRVNLSTVVKLWQEQYLANENAKLTSQVKRWYPELMGVKADTTLPRAAHG